jgi:hypothetical protein
MAGPIDLLLLLRHTDRVFSLQPGQTLTAGRTSQCDLQIDDPSVSRRHLRSREAIPFLGRLLGVADVYDALTSARSYRGAMSTDDAIAMIAEGAGRHFDPAVAAALVRLYERGRLNLDEMPSEIRQMLPAR